MALEPAEAVLVCVLYKLQHEDSGPVLADWELIVFILQFYVLKSMSLEDLRGQEWVLPSPRSAQLAVLFSRYIIFIFD